MSTSDITSKLFIAPGVPATRNKAGYEALTWTQVKGIVSIGATGTTNSPIEVPDLETGFTLAVKGARAGNVVAVAMREVKADEGQADFKAAAVEAASVEYSFKIAEPTAGATDEVEYISGIVMNWTRNERSTTTYAGFTCSIRQNYDSLLVAAPT